MKEHIKECAVEQYLRTQCSKRGFLCLKFISPSNDGVPDRTIIGHGHTFFVETKAPGGEPRKLQKSVIRRMRQHGALVYVIDSKNGVDELLNVFCDDAPENRLSELKTYEK